MDLNLALFLLLGVLAIASAVAVVAAKNPISAAMFLVLHFLTLAGLYLTLSAQFMAAIQVLVYAGAIMVLVVFVIMLLNLGTETSIRHTLTSREGIGVALAMLVGGSIIFVLMRALGNEHPEEARALANGTVDAVGRALFTTYVFPFEMISLVLLAAVVGAVVLTKRHLQ
jgi:NADH-quinone oxidoreductase subunit J